MEEPDFLSSEQMNSNEDVGRGEKLFSKARRKKKKDEDMDIRLGIVMRAFLLLGDSLSWRFYAPMRDSVLP